MGAEAETLILCTVAMDCPRESLQLIAACLGEVYHLRPGETRQQVHRCSTVRLVGCSAVVSPGCLRRCWMGGVRRYRFTLIFLSLLT